MHFKLLDVLILLQAIVGAADIESRDEQSLWATLEFYEDGACETPTNYVDFYDTDILYPAGYARCFAPELSPRKEVWARMSYAISDETEMLITREDWCESSNFMAQTIAAFRANSDQCVWLGHLSGNEGMKIFRVGGSDLILLGRPAPPSTLRAASKPSERPANVETITAIGSDTVDTTFMQSWPTDAFNASETTQNHDLVSTNTVGWDGCFRFTSPCQYESASNGMRISSLADCRGSDVPCYITSEQQFKKSFRNIWNVPDGVTLGHFDVLHVFGPQYDYAVETTIGGSQAVRAGQIGYIMSSFETMIFIGEFLDCRERGQARVAWPIKNAEHHSIVYTNF